MTYSLLLSLLLLSAIWGASFLFIKIGVATIGPFTFATLRVLTGALTLLVAVIATRQKLPREFRTWRHFAFMGVFGILLPFAAISWGTQYIPSGLSAILNATMPLFTVILAALVGAERLVLRRVLGVLLGFAGIVVLTSPQLKGGVVQASLWGELAIVLASLSYAVSILYARHNVVHQPPIVTSLGQVSMGCLFLIPLSLAEKPWTFSPSTAAIAAVLAVGILGTGIAYILYYRLLQGLGATGTSLVTNIVPVFGIFWGWLILGERLGWPAFVALATILGGLVLVNGLTVRGGIPASIAKEAVSDG